MSRDAAGLARSEPAANGPPALPLDFPPEAFPPVDYEAHDLEGDEWDDVVTRPGAIDPGLLLLSAVVGGLAALAVATLLGVAAWWL